MRTQSTFSISFWINTSRMVQGKANIYSRITLNGRRVNLSLKYTIEDHQWDSKHSRVKGRAKQAVAINAYLKEVEAQLFQCYRELRLDNANISAEMVKARFFGEDREHKSLLDLFEYHNLHCDHLLSRATIRHYVTTQKYLNEYIRKRFNRKDMRLEELDHPFIVGFETFLRNKRPRHYQGKIANNGAMKHIQRLRKMARMALDNEWLNTDPFRRYRIKLEK